MTRFPCPLDFSERTDPFRLLWRNEMKSSPISVAMLLVSLLLAPALLAQSPVSANQNAASPSPSASAAEVPRLIKFSGTLLDAQDRPMAGPVGVTFALYSQQTGGAALWLETQNVKPDANGVYTVLLGANSANGVPAELFASAEARWLAVQAERQAEQQPRVLLVSVPYALKAADAETLGGKPASAFVTTETLAGAGTPAGASAPSSSTASTSLPISNALSTLKKAASTPQPAVACSSVTSDGAAAVNSIALFTTNCNIEGSLMTQALINGFPGVSVAGNNAGLLLTGTGTHQVTVTGATSGRLGQDAGGFFFASDSSGSSVRFLTNNGTLHEWMRITSAGNVGIGTATPGAKLEIAGGNLALPNTSSGGSMGVLTLGGVPFLHNFGPSGPFGLPSTFVGASAGNFSTTGESNAAFGTFALNANTTGSFNSAFGSQALQQNMAGGNNSAFGSQALQQNTTGGNNSAFGGSALSFNTTGASNSAFGLSALVNNTTGNNNAAFGFDSLFANTTGSFNSAFGFDSLFANTMGNGNSAFGVNSLSSNTTGLLNSAFGFQVLSANTTGNFNSAFGDRALNANTTGVNNAAFGSLALFINTTGNENAAFGNNALNANTTGGNNAAFGFNALLSNTTGGGNAAFGSFALQNNTTSFENSAFGYGALKSNTTGLNNSAFGTNALVSNTTGADNSAFGLNALLSSSTGRDNAAFGEGALEHVTTGNFNIGIGVDGGFNLTGADSNNIEIGNIGVSGESNTIRIGTVGQHAAAFMAGINGATSASGTAVFVNSSGQLGTVTSSRRFKDDIADMASESDMLMKLRPVAFYYKPGLDPTHTRQYGLLAEEVAQVSPQLVVFDKDGVPQTVRYHFVNAMLLNEVQKQRQLVEEQQGTIARQQAEIQDLAARLAKLEALVAPVP